MFFLYCRKNSSKENNFFVKKKKKIMKYYKVLDHPQNALKTDLNYPY